MDSKRRQSMDPLVKWLVPMLYPDTPTLLGLPLASSKEDLKGADLAIVGAPYQGAPGVTREYSNNLLTPVNIRKDSVKYGSYLPEFDLDPLDELKVVDYGDASVAVRGDIHHTIEAVSSKIKDVLEVGAIPIVIGGTEVGSSLPLVQELNAKSKSGVGCITLDAHGDNMESHGGEKFCGASWINRMSELPKVNMSNHVHLGMRGPRNFKEQVHWYREKGTTLFTSREIKKRGMEDIARETISTVMNNTDKVFMSIDYDVLDIGCAPGLDEPMGISVEDLLTLCLEVGKNGIDGFSIGWIPTSNKPLHWIAIWTFIYLMAGIAMRIKDSGN